MSSRELRQLIEDSEVWLSRPQNRGQATIVHRLRSSQRHHGRHSDNDGQQSFSNSGTERRGRRARAPPHHRRQERNTVRSRSPISRVSLEPLRTTEHSTLDDEQESGSSTTTTALEFQLPDTILQSDTAREVLAPGRTIGASSSVNQGREASESATTTTEIRFRLRISISLNHRPMNAGHETSGSAATIIEFRLANQIPPRSRFSEVLNADNILDMLSRLLGIRRPMPHVQPQAPPPSRTLQIDSLPTRTITSQEDIASCIICITEYEPGEQVTVLPCNHNYHQSCILTWLQSNPTCPLCRNNCFT